MKILFGVCALGMALAMPGLAMAGVDLTVNHGVVWQTLQSR